MNNEYTVEAWVVFFRASILYSTLAILLINSRADKKLNWELRYHKTQCKTHGTEENKSQRARETGTEGEAEIERRVSIAFSTASWIIEGPVVCHWVVSYVICHPGAAIQWLSCSTHTHTRSIWSMGGLLALPRHLLFTHTNTPGATTLVLCE